MTYFAGTKYGGCTLSFKYGQEECYLDSVEYIPRKDKTVLVITHSKPAEATDKITKQLVSQEASNKLSPILIETLCLNGNKRDIKMDRPFCTSLSQTYSQANPDAPSVIEFKAIFEQIEQE